jgi:carboxypeptidase C (cathepsin A)
LSKPRSARCGRVVAVPTLLWTCLAVLAFLLPLGARPADSAEPAATKGAEERASVSIGLPSEVETKHEVTLSGERLSFTARAGAVRLFDGRTGAPTADVAVVSYERLDTDPATRPVVFVFNGGPGASSAWLGLGAISPWRLRLEDGKFTASTAPDLVENSESWLAFADLVFIDPPGAGYSKFLSENEDVRKHFHSVEGDVDSLAVVLRKWLTAHGRLVSPKFLVGESYGGLRVLKLAGALRERENIGVQGLVLISAALDFSWMEGSRNLLSYAAYLPSFAAISRGSVSRRDVADVEAYAVGEYVTDLLKGPNDKTVVARISAKVSGLIGLDLRTVALLAGRVDTKTFLRERLKASGRVLSLYDGGVASFDPNPFSRESDWPDPVLDALRAPLGAAMTRVEIEKLRWPIGDTRYEILNDQVARHWDYGRGGRSSVEAISDLREALAFDLKLKVLIVHGIADLVTPYFATKLLLDQAPAFGDGSRLVFLVLPGGHMLYMHDDSRKMLRDAARQSIEGK